MHLWTESKSNKYIASFEFINYLIQSENVYKVDYEKHKAERGGIPIAYRGKDNVLVFNDSKPQLIVGSMGAGKTCSLLIPRLLSSAYAGESLVVYDPKGELREYTSKILEERGYTVLVYSLREPDKGEAYNPLQLILDCYKNGHQERAQEVLSELAEVVFSAVSDARDPSWEIGSREFFKGLVELQMDLEEDNSEDCSINFKSISHMQAEAEKSYGKTTLLQDFLHKNPDAEYYDKLAAVAFTAEQTRSSYLSVFLDALAAYTGNEKIIKQLCNSTFTAEDIIENKTVLYIVGRDETNIYNSLVSTMIRQIYLSACYRASMNSGGKLARRLTFLLDEFGNLPVIVSMNNMISNSRGKNIDLVIGIQSRAQLQALYGSDTTENVFANANIAYMQCQDLAFIEYISQLCGDTYDEVANKQRRLVSSECLRRFRRGEVLFLLQGWSPFVRFLPDVSMYSATQQDIPLKTREDMPIKIFSLEKAILKHNIKKQMEEAETVEIEKKNEVVMTAVAQDILKMADQLFEELNKEE